MIEAILILNIIILVVVLLMVPIVSSTNQDLDSRKADSRKIREMHDHFYELKRRELVQEHEESIAELKQRFADGGGYYPNGGNTSATLEEAVKAYVQMAREAIYELDCKKHAYMAFNNGTVPKWPDGEENYGYTENWRWQIADGRYHESDDTK